MKVFAYSGCPILRLTIARGGFVLSGTLVTLGECDIVATCHDVGILGRVPFEPSPIFANAAYFNGGLHTVIAVEMLDTVQCLTVRNEILRPKFSSVTGEDAERVRNFVKGELEGWSGGTYGLRGRSICASWHPLGILWEHNFMEMPDSAAMIGVVDGLVAFAYQHPSIDRVFVATVPPQALSWVEVTQHMGHLNFKPPRASERLALQA